MTEEFNPYKDFIMGKISVEELSMFTGLDKEMICDRLKFQLDLAEHEYSPLSELRSNAEILQSEIKKALDIEDDRSRIDALVKLSDQIRKLTITIEDIRSASMIPPEVKRQLMKQDPNAELVNLVVNLSTYLCGNCRLKLSKKLMEIQSKL